MAFRKFKADRLFDGYRFREASSVLITAEDGTVEAIVDTADAGNDVEQYNGILSPGLINCHCHLELSHLKDVIPPHTGLIDFLCTVVTKRNFSPEEIRKKIIEAEAELFSNGTIAVGDIGNTVDTAVTKSSSKIRWQNFVEVLGFTDEKALENLQRYENVLQEMETTLQDASVPNRSTLVPHAPYSISPKLFDLINEATAGKIISIHNQEHPAEDELYQTGGGDFLKLFRIFGIQESPFPVTGKTSIRSYLPHFTKGQTIFLVHNTYTSAEDIKWANEYATANGLTLIWCLCINANLYIENKVPPAELLLNSGCHVAIGTDSYSSNWQLNVTKEMQSLLKHTSLSEEQVLTMATINGAKALQWENELGSFEKGKQPGVIVIENDFSASKRIL